ncbi:MAG TPA: hypothetical protein PKC67_03270 [Kiritimatiellia bacterium]|nr:hypothetical protein [Kiritimatiellia bacterium]HMP33347.1 hypothetical protein [Kiritimatiellia bacterium]
MRRSESTILALPLLALAGLLAAAPAAAFTTNDTARFVREKMWPLHPLHPDTADLREELEHEITRLLDRYDAGGHLEPAYFTIGITGSWILYGYPGEQAYILSDALPYLSTGLQARVKHYLAAEIRAYDPTSIAFEHCDWGWGSCELAGNRRELFTIPTSPNPQPVTPNLWPPPTIPPEGLYMIWRYCDRTGDWPFISATSPASGERWNRMLSMFQSIPDPPTRYGHIAAAIGMARILEHYGMTNGHPYTTAVSRVHVGLLAGTNFNLFANRSYTNFIGGTHDWAWTPFHYQRTANAIGAMLAPEIGRFLREFAYTSVVRRVTANPLEGQPGEPYAIESVWQSWYLTRGAYVPLIPLMGYYGENHMVTPDTPWALFMTHAWIYNESGPELRRWLDTPYSLGDLFHLQRLTATIAAHGGIAWSPAEPPRIRTVMTPSGDIHIVTSGSSNALYAIERSTNLATWHIVMTNAGPEWSITNHLHAPWHFYRARTEP